MRAIRLITLALLTLMNLPFHADAKDQEGHTLTKLWADYDKAVKADLPRNQADILEKIKKEASEKRLAWDFYDACEKYVDVRSSTNWKLRDELRRKAGQEIEAFGEPVAVYFYRMRNGRDADLLRAYLQKHKERLQQTYNPEFYSRDGSLSGLDYTPALLPLLKNDYEYALWSLFSFYADNDTRQLIQQHFDGRYPFDALIEFTVLQRMSTQESKPELEKYAGKYAGKAVALLARDVLLTYRQHELNRDEASTSAQYRALADDCTRLIEDRKRFSGSEKAIADCCTRADHVLDIINRPRIEAAIKDNRLDVQLVNLSQVQVRIVKKYGDDKKPLFTRTLKNPDPSFYLPDTLTCELPDFSDGSYLLQCESGKNKFEIDYDRYTLSVATKHDRGGYAVYVADYITGEPVSRCDIWLLENGKKIDEIKDFPIDGYSYLPESFTRPVSNKARDYTLQTVMQSGDLRRSSKRIGLDQREAGSISTDNPDTHHATILTDRSAFRPDETVNYKVLLYKGTYAFEALPAGTPLRVTLTDPAGKQIGEEQLTTNEFGTAAGSFVLKKGERGGLFEITVFEGKNQLASTSVRADEFVLPTFELTWKPDTRFYFPKDTVLVEGNIRSYSGHSLGAADATYCVSGRGGTVSEGKLDLSASGDFSIRFQAPEQGRTWYAPPLSVTVTVTDATGETLEFDRYVVIKHNLSLRIEVLNPVPGNFDHEGSYEDWPIIGTDDARIRFRLGYDDEDKEAYPRLEIRYEVQHEDKTVLSGTASCQEELRLDLSGLPSGMYRIQANAKATSDDGKVHESEETSYFAKVSDSDTLLDMDVTSFFKEVESKDGIALQVGATNGPVWMVVELFGNGNQPLERRMVRLAGVRGKEGSLQMLRFARKATYPEHLTLRVFWFRDKTSYSYEVTSYKPKDYERLPLGFTRFLDTTAPHHGYSFIIQTAADVELAATIFDKSTETIEPNYWFDISPRLRVLPEVVYREATGENVAGAGFFPQRFKTLGNSAVVGYGVRRNAPGYEAYAAMTDEAMAEDALAEAAPALGASAKRPSVDVREDFANTIAWEPFLRSDKDGQVTFNFTSADKLSTYYVQLFAHDKTFHNATLRQEMVVTLPVKVAVVQPQYLYEGDKYVARVSVSNSLDAPVSGRISVCFLDGKDHKTAPLIAEQEQALTVPADGSAEFSCAISAPAVADLGLLVSFIADQADYGSDAVFVTLPVKPAAQTITEAHSALMLSWMDREAILTALRGEFVNVPGSAATLREVSILDMIREAVPEKVLPTSDNLLDQTESLFANWLLDRLPDAKGSGATQEQRAEMCAKILGCRGEDGGFGWFAGMSSSPLLTCVLLERLAAMGDTCPQELADAIPAAVKYLDDKYFSDAARPIWCGGISLDQYLHTRSLFPEVAFEPGADTKTLRAFKKRAKEYLAPGKVRGLNGQVFAKARRMKTLRALLQSETGTALARKWGISLFAKGRLSRSLDKDVASLLQYAEPHKSGGTYYPNAVMPWRGLLESELYAHTLICDLLSASGHDVVAEGIRLWIMVQKETQHWEDDPAYIQAIDCVLRGSEETLQTKVLALSATTTLPFRQVKAAGNGFTVSRTYTRDGRPLQDGDELHVGDKILATYLIWNEENRSFVRLSAPRPAAFRPVEQRSGSLGWSGRPISITGWVSFSPQGYRSVLADRTEFWFDSYPEEHTRLFEEFFVTQEGTFQSPVLEIESLYAPHYRANDAGHPAITVKP